MSQPWDNWTKPWSREQCKERYVRGDKISIRQIALASGRAKSSMERWRQDDNWEDDRRQYQVQLGTSVTEKAIEKTSERLSDEIADIAIANYQAHKMVRDYVVELIQIRVAALEEDKKRDDLNMAAILKKHGAESLNYLSLALARATQEIATVTGLQYHVDINAAIRRIEREGLGIERVADSNLTKESTKVSTEN